MTSKISVLGSTGSIGTQTLDVARMHGIKVTALTANKNIRLLEQQAREFNPTMVCVLDLGAAAQLKIALKDTDIEVYCGEEGIIKAAEEASCDTVVNAIVGVAGLLPTIAAIKAGKNIALANKETLVAGGSIVMKEVKNRGLRLYPVDSEHSAIFQCLQGCPENSLKKIILTASGGSFFGKTKEELMGVSVKEALHHPNWNMGAKITIDSATMMNKGLEVIEASWLFDCKDQDIDVLIHRESIIHSMIQLKDNAVIAQLGVPDMRIPIQYALTYPERLASPTKELDLTELTAMTFYKPDYETFECLAICREALRKGGLYPAVANAANEVAVELFLKERIKFLDIASIVSDAVSGFNENKTDISLEDILYTDKETRQKVREKY
ncbi:MAG: 1-deoxy-D-xylulose-5-phosphate reductoisomerase [Clostridia bacterium]|nr:1-deoxy-D-xylulose-5-phosphate reductoisomerase [Clostridia bacterium]MBR2175568.1 1-deoxy-D-xylulose-5-phosphate reductoisomerase [Clostridia bacterium]